MHFVTKAMPINIVNGKHHIDEAEKLLNLFDYLVQLYFMQVHSY